MAKVKVMADRFLNFGKQPDGKILFFREGEVKEVELTEQIVQALEVGLLKEVKDEEEKPKRGRKKKEESE